MTQSTTGEGRTRAVGRQGGAATAGETMSSTSGSGSGLVTQHGKTSIADGVVAKIAGIAAREVSGVHNLGGGTARAMGAVRERMGGQTHSQGVSVEVGERQAAVDVDVVLEYGTSIADVAEGIRRNVISSIERMTGLEVTEVNVAVNDIFIPGTDDDSGSEQGSRVQ